MQRWEYKFVLAISEAEANRLGHEGWELVGFNAYDNVAVFKRRI